LILVTKILINSSVSCKTSSNSSGFPIQRSMLDVRCSMFIFSPSLSVSSSFPIQRSMLDVRCSMFIFFRLALMPFVPSHPRKRDLRQVFWQAITQ
jgi:hypothetical protein